MPPGIQLLKIGELARRTGLTVRALHHYDEIGLLQPSQRSESGYRLYNARDVARLMQILSLRQLGLPLEEIRDCLSDEGSSLRSALALQIQRIRDKIATHQELLGRLQALAARIDDAEEITVDELTTTMEMMTMYEKYYTSEQLNQLEQRKQAVGAERIREVEAEWPELIAKVRAAMDQGIDPTSPPVQELARRWMGLVSEFTGGDPAIAASLERMYKEEDSVRQMTGIDPAIMQYVQKAMEAAKTAG